jgi:hypothetical protein
MLHVAHRNPMSSNDGTIDGAPTKVLAAQPSKQHQVRRMFAGAVFESLAQTIPDLLADRAAVNAVDLNIRGVGQSRHEISSSSGLKPQAPDQCDSAE